MPQPVAEVSEVGGLTALTEESVVVGKIKLSADVRTNRIHVITRPVNMPFVRRLVSEFDANVEFAHPVTRALNYISAADVLPVIVQALTEPGQTGAGGAEGAAVAAPVASPTQPRRTTTATAAGGGIASTTSTTGGPSSSTSGTLNVSEELETQAVDTTPKAVTIGNAKIIADQRANTIIVLGNREVVVKVAKILDEMDVKAPQVVLSTVIGELSLSNDQEFGVDYFQKFKHITANSVQGGIAGVSRNTNAALVDPASLINFSQLATAAATGGTNVFLSTGFGLKAIVNMLDQTGRFRVLNRPVIFTSNNKKAIIASGQEVPVPVSTLSTINNTNVLPGTTPFNNFGTQSSIQFKKVALQLEVVPLINSEKEVTLDILQKLDSLGTPAIVDGNAIPTIVTRYIKTTVSAPNCATIVLGGLITDEKRYDKSGIPVLSRIPLIGPRCKVKDRKELIVLMRPEVALTKLDLYRLRQKVEDRTHIGPDLDHEDCPDCPKPGDGKQLELPPPDLPGMK